MHSRTIRGA